ncbi:ribonuclease H-like domain-containing protein [Mycena rosella]|uniref:Ribonuclease n=1 Tax=Mycena rosella TaxID=1033263 RepID=A0AAD7GY30_MYCRO|nr:ribonuclease H-like domain-containing protein [Mycena rosella]
MGDDELTIPSAPGPSTPLRESYTYHSPTPTADGPYMLGVDEAGRGPVLGPLVYGVAYCPIAYTDKLDDLGFADSKTLTAATRSTLLNTLGSDPDNMAWSVRVISPQAISSGMLRRPPTNLNIQSQDATVLLIQEVLKKGIELTEVYVDALGNTTTYQAYLSSRFPGINFTVESKADDKFKIVGAASVAAKVTRDACIEDWVFEENANGASVNWDTALGSGYPSDPRTKAWLRESLDPVFGLPKIARFSWSTVKVLLEKEGKAVDWIDDGQASLIQAFESAKGREKDRCAVAKDLGLKSVGML